MVGDQNEKTRYENDHTGVRLSTSVGTGTGEGGDFRVLDDPHNQEDIHSDKIRESDLDWWTQTWSTRANDPKRASEVIVMQRLHERDLTGYALAEVGGYDHLCLPMRFEPDRACVTSIGWQDPRRAAGELLWPERMGEEELKPLQKRLGNYGVAGQHQQLPTPAGGGIFRKRWWGYWYPAHLNNGRSPLPVKAQNEDGVWVDCEQRPLPERMDRQIQSWDCAFKDSRSSSYVVGQVWGALGADAYLLDQVRDKMDLPATCAAVAAISARHPAASAKYVEDKANGPAVIQTLQGRIPGLIPVNPQGDKVARAHAASPYVEAGNVWLPHPAVFPWVNDYLAEVGMFPNGEYNDQVDAMTQALMKLLGHAGSGDLLAAAARDGRRAGQVFSGMRSMSF
jgi:predicted phage terminase large subunit-like protein